MKIEEIQHGGDHYKDQPKHLQPIWLATALNLNPMEYSVLKYLLRHRKKAGLEDLKKMVHFAQMLMEHEYGVCPVVVYPEQDSPSDVSGEETASENCDEFDTIDECEAVTIDDLPPSVRYQLPNVGEQYVNKLHRTGPHWQVVQVSADFVKLTTWTNSKNVNMKTFIQNYERIPDAEKVADPEPQAPCPFQVDDIIQSQKLFENHHCPKWHIYRIEDDKVLVSCAEDKQPGEIRREDWGNYSVVGRKAPYRLPVVGELYKSAHTGDSYKVTKVDGADWVYLERVSTKVPYSVQWRLGSGDYTLQESLSTSRYPVVGEIYKRRKSGNMYRVCQVKDENIRLQDFTSGYTHTVNWNSGLSSDYERVPDET